MLEAEMKGISDIR